MPDYTDMLFEPGEALLLERPDDASSSIDPSPPVIEDPSPPPTLIGRAQPFSVSIRDERGLSFYGVFARFGATYEVIWDGEEWGPRYRSSTKSPLSGGQRLTIVREEGWPSPPHFRIVAIDRGGNVT